jgi:hypothetical protein
MQLCPIWGWFRKLRNHRKQAEHQSIVAELQSGIDTNNRDIIPLQNKITNLRNQGFALARKNTATSELLVISQQVTRLQKALKTHKRTLTINQRLLFAVQQRQRENGTVLYERVWSYLGVDSDVVDKQHDIMDGIQETVAMMD